MQWVGPEYSKHEENWDSTDSNLLYLHGLVSCQAAWAGDKKRSLRRCMVSFTWLCKWFAQSDEPTHAAPQLSMVFHTFHASSSSKSWCQWEPPHDIGKMRVPQWRVNGISIWKKSCIVMQQSRCHQHKHIRKSGLVQNCSHCWSQSGSCVLEKFQRFSRSPRSLSPPNGWPQRRKWLACVIWGRFLVKHTRFVYKSENRMVRIVQWSCFTYHGLDWLLQLWFLFGSFGTATWVVPSRCFAPGPHPVERTGFSTKSKALKCLGYAASAENIKVTHGSLNTLKDMFWNLFLLVVCCRHQGSRHAAWTAPLNSKNTTMHKTIVWQSRHWQSL